MSGVFLIVSNFDDARVADVLHHTAGGYPHITVVYTGKAPRLDLASVAHSVFKATLAQGNDLQRLTLRAKHVRVNSFFHEKSQRTRHDVLIDLDVVGTGIVARVRELLPPPFKDGGLRVMREPHVTHSIHESSASAEEAAAELRAKLPLDVFITGATID